MKHHIGILSLFFALAVGAALAWFVLDNSVPGYRPPTCHCTHAPDRDESADDDTPELL